MLMYGKVAQWLRFWAVNHDCMGSDPAETNNSANSMEVSNQVL